jgi:hypothetical protein
MRDRLIELLYEANEKFADCDCSDDEAVEILSDHLLANGVIVPPCKVGDTVYRIVGDGSILAWDIISMECFVDEIGFVDDSDNWIAFDDFGKTVFLTKEEAEQALKGGGEK